MTGNLIAMPNWCADPATCHAEMAAFDSLPPGVRRAFREARLCFSALDWIARGLKYVHYAHASRRVQMSEIRYFQAERRPPRRAAQRGA